MIQNRNDIAYQNECKNNLDCVYHALYEDRCVYSDTVVKSFFLGTF